MERWPVASLPDKNRAFGENILTQLRLGIAEACSRS